MRNVVGIADLLPMGTQLRIDIEVNNIKYKLVHASPEENYLSSPYYVYEYENEQEFAVWERWRITNPVPEGFILIFGHTPTCYFQDNEPLSIWKSDRAIGIDCGCGYDDRRLGCIRLDDMQEFYSE